MTQPFLIMRNRSTTHTKMAVFKDIDRQLVQIGADFGTDEPNANGTNFFPQLNRVIRFQDDLWCIGDDQIWKYDVSLNTGWVSTHTFATATQDPSLVPGFVAASVDGEPKLFTVYGTSATNARPVIVDKDGTITERGNRAWNIDTWSNNGKTPVWSPTAYRNGVYFIAADNGYLSFYDLKTDTLATDPVSMGGPESLALTNIAILNDKAWVVQGGGGGDMHLKRFDGATHVDMGTVQINKTDLAAERFKGSLVPINGDLYAVLYKNEPSVDEGWETFQIEINADNTMGTVTNRTLTTLPVQLRNKTSGFFTQNKTNCLPRIDNISNNGASLPTYEFDFLTSYAEGTSRVLYTWDGDYGNTWTKIDAGLDAAKYTYVCQVDGSTGERIWSGSGTLNASAPSLAVSGANIYTTFKVYGASQTGVSAEIIYNQEGQITHDIGTLASTNVGTINGNVVEGLTADGSTDVTLVWAAAVDGLLTGDNPKVAIRVFI